MIVYGPEPHREPNGLVTRNKILQPCGCWTGFQWRHVPLPGCTVVPRAAPWNDPAPLNATYGARGELTGELRLAPDGGVEGWVLSSSACQTHACVAVLATIESAPAMLEHAGPRHLYEAREHVLAEAAALDAEIKLLTGAEPPTIGRQLAGVLAALLPVKKE